MTAAATSLPLPSAETVSDLECPTHSEEGRRDRKKRATRQALRNAAIALVVERGFAHVTVEDIADAADVSTRTFFNYFPSKESAVIGADPERIEEVRMNLLARPAEESPLQALRAVTIDYTESIDEEYDDLGECREAWFRRFSAVREDPELLDAYSAHISSVERVLVEAMAERLGTDTSYDPYPALVTAAVFAATRIAALYWSANGGVGSLTKLTAAAIDSVADGLVDRDALGLLAAESGPLLRGASAAASHTGHRRTPQQR